ncbi:hypothetical protein MFLAVUS_005433 [Mucor flavus]|uniref:Uncharacterized protein n=1 Tax=Mucor flavus TaxID=439312 RepID=A0ABP9YYS3_9FUNG
MPAIRLKTFGTTGISEERVVERMEYRIRLDVIQELNEYEGRMLLRATVENCVLADQIETASQTFEYIRDGVC